MVPINWYLYLSLLLFCVGLAGFMLRRNLIMIFISIEIMLNAIALCFVSLGYYLQDLKGHVIALFIIGTAAAAVAVGLIILVIVYRNKPTLDIDEFKLLKEE